MFKLVCLLFVISFLYNTEAVGQVIKLKVGSSINKKLLLKGNHSLEALNSFLAVNQPGKLIVLTEVCVKTTGKKVKYIKKVSNLPDQITLTFNDISIKGPEVIFQVRDGSCDMLNLRKFTSAKDQLFGRVDIKKEDMISEVIGLEKAGIYPTALLDANGYLVDESKSNCLGVSNSKTKDKTYPNMFYKYIYKGKEYQPKDVFKASLHLDGPSKYYGNRICSMRSKAVISCASQLWTFEEAFNTVENKPKIINKLMKNKGVCDAKIAAYEKKTGKKIPVSPFIPKEVLQRVLKGKYPYPNTQRPRY